MMALPREKVSSPNKVDDLSETESKAVSIPPNIKNIKHLLASAWTLWHYKYDK